MNLDEINIEDLLPQSMPFIMIDKIIEFKKGESLTAIKNVTANEWFFKNQPPDKLYMPETLVIEAAAQTAVLFAKLSQQMNLLDNQFLMLSKIFAEFEHSVMVSETLKIQTSNNKFMKSDGYVDLNIYTHNKMLGRVNIFYSIR